MKHLILLIIAFLTISSVTICQDDVTPASLYNDGLAALKSKDYGKALDLLDQALAKADPEEDKKVVTLANRNGAIAAYYYGSMLAKEDQHEKAMQAYNKGISMNADFYGNYVGLAKIHLDKDEVAGAVKNYLKAGNLRTKAGSPDKAQSYFENVDKIIAIAYSKEQLEETLAACDVALVENETAEVHYYKAKALVDSGSEKEALTNAMKAHEIGGDAEESKYVFLVAEVYEALGDNAKALEYYKNVGKGKYYDLAQYKVNQSQ